MLLDPGKIPAKAGFEPGIFPPPPLEADALTTRPTRRSITRVATKRLIFKSLALTPGILYSRRYMIEKNSKLLYDFFLKNKLLCDRKKTPQ